ncbi:hypothetical protein GA0070560_12562 [Micromonospora halophytica]|uniref:Uncharacterized protein n=1 Tax=Micromonospora halophytica TaxID=47864 RepID=A0A1C5JB41_9ACTN|nr:hypothetical protein GA0070560_12562 [Micromonospora halophytica]
MSLPAWLGPKGFSDNHMKGVPTTATGLFLPGSTRPASCAS